MERRSILLVEDDRLTAEALKSELEAAGVDVHVVHGAAAALELLVGEHPPIDLALVDYKLPDGCGVSFGRQALAEHGIPFALLTAYSDPSTVGEATAAGAIAYVVKPVTAAEVLPVIETAIARASEMQRLIEMSRRAAATSDSRRHSNIAAGILMERFGLTEDDAMRLVRHYARSHRLTMDDAALRVMDRSASLELVATLSRMVERV